MILVGLWRGLDRDLSRRAAVRWIAAHLAPSDQRHRLGIAALRSECERETQRYVPRTVMAAALAAAGIRVDGDQVFAK